MSLPHFKNTPTSPLSPIWESLFEIQASLPESFLENITGSQSLTNELKQQLDELSRTKKELIQKYLNKGYTQEQAENTAMRIMYIPGFSGPTFKD